jgi:gamma-glutamyltranspeptidase/glutathione hydrolase
VQVAVGLLDDHLDPQAALDRPRFYVEPGSPRSRVHLEDGVPAAVAEGLRARGHEVEAGIGGHERAMFGRGQIILRSEDGVLWAGSDPRADGCAMGF